MNRAEQFGLMAHVTRIQAELSSLAKRIAGGVDWPDDAESSSALVPADSTPPLAPLSARAAFPRQGEAASKFRLPQSRMDLFKSWMSKKGKGKSANNYLARVRMVEANLQIDLADAIRNNGLLATLQLVDTLRSRGQLALSTISSLPSAVKLYAEFLEEEEEKGFAPLAFFQTIPVQPIRVSFHIPHQFLDTSKPQRIRILIIGTFNPGRPIETQISEDARQAFDKYLNENGDAQFQILNYYDRPQNRFWGVLDRLYAPAYYQEHGMDARRPNGLKYYAEHGNRLQVRQNQDVFCEAQGILITDLIKQVVTSDLDAVYKNFSDSAIDALVPDDGWNTENILSLIATEKPEVVLFTFQPNPVRIPKISAQVELIRAAFPGADFLMSPSGSAKHPYELLAPAYAEKLPLTEPS